MALSLRRLRRVGRDRVPKGGGYRYDAFGRRLTKVRQFTDTERAWVAKRHPALVSQADREGTVLWTWPQAPNGHAAHDPRPPVVGTHFLWDGDVVAEEAPLRLDGSIDWQDATRWHFEPESFVPVAKQMPDGSLAYIVVDHLGTPREMFDEVGGLRWAASVTTWGVVRRVITPPEAANDDGRQAIYPRASARGNLALKSDRDTAAYDCPIRFQGQWEDEETGLHYNRYRHYDSTVGQFASSDPIGLGGGYRPQGYVASPTVWTDALGLLRSYPDGSIRTPDGKFASPKGQSAPGTADAKRFAEFLRSHGVDVVGEERVVVTPFGRRRYDIVTRNKDGSLHGVEVKSYGAGRDTSQIAKDNYVNRFGGSGVGEIAGETVSGTTTVYLPKGF